MAREPRNIFPDTAYLSLELKGLSEIVPTFETAFVLACHYAISKLRQGMCHH